MDMRETFPDLITLKGKTAVITGGASGIGLENSKLLGKAGASLALFDLDSEKGEKAVSEIKKSGGKAIFFTGDVSSNRDCLMFVASTISEYGKIDILFNNAGTITRKSVVDLHEKEWDINLDVTLKGIYLMSHHVIPHMIKSGGGSIINSGSGWSLKGGPDAAAYCAAKGGVLNLTRAMAIDFGKHNIRVNCVCPGDIDTPMLRKEAQQLGIDFEEFRQEAASRPLARLGKPEDVARVVLFFASELSTWVTGAFLVVDGGGIA